MRAHRADPAPKGGRRLCAPTSLNPEAMEIVCRALKCDKLKDEALRQT